MLRWIATIGASKQPWWRAAPSIILSNTMAVAGKSIRELIPARGALLSVLVVGTLGVVILPEAADIFPSFGTKAQARYAATGAGILLLTAIYIDAVARAATPVLDRVWIMMALAYGAVSVIVRFLLSPVAFEKTIETSLRAFLLGGLAVMPLYIVALVLLFRVSAPGGARRPLAHKLGLAGGLAVVAVGARLMVTSMLGEGSTRLGDQLGARLVLPVIVALASLAAIESFERAGRAARFTLHAGIALIVSHHLLWIIYMNRLFS